MMGSTEGAIRGRTRGQFEAAGEKRVLVLGAEVRGRNVSCVPWERWTPELNPSDYDVVVLNILSLNGAVLERVGQNPLSGMRATITKLLETDGEVVAIGRPARWSAMGLGDDPFGQVEVGWLDWCPLDLRVEELKGETMREVSPRFTRYLGLVACWYFCLGGRAGLGWLKKWYAERWPDKDREEALKVGWRMSVIASNRAGDAVAGSISWSVTTWVDVDGGLEEMTLMDSAPIHILPPPTEVRVEEGIEMVLADLYGVRRQTEEPGWAGEITVPGEAGLESEIEAAKRALSEAEGCLLALGAQRDRQTSMRAMLYEDGEALEEVVRQVLEELARAAGGSVEPPTKGEEDGWLVGPWGRAVLEIKGYERSIALRAARELEDWRTSAELEGKDCKGILIGNHFRHLPLGERGEAFPDNVVKFTERRNTALVATVELFQAWCAFREGLLTAKRIIASIFSTSGLWRCPLPEQRALLGQGTGE